MEFDMFISTGLQMQNLVQELKKQLDCASLQFHFDSIFEDFYVWIQS